MLLYFACHSGKKSLSKIFPPPGVPSLWGIGMRTFPFSRPHFVHQRCNFLAECHHRCFLHENTPFSLYIMGPPLHNNLSYYFQSNLSCYGFYGRLTYTWYMSVNVCAGSEVQLFCFKGDLRMHLWLLTLTSVSMTSNY